jgi:hypothetical protein
MRSARWQSIADLPIVAHRGLRHHRGIAREYCPSSSAVARQPIGQDRFSTAPQAEYPPIGTSYLRLYWLGLPLKVG